MFNVYLVPPMGYSQFENDGEVLSVIIRLAVRYTIQIDTVGGWCVR